MGFIFFNQAARGKIPKAQCVVDTRCPIMLISPLLAMQSCTLKVHFQEI